MSKGVTEDQALIKALDVVAPLARWWPAGAGLGVGVVLAAVGSVAPWVAGGLWLVAFGAAWRWGR